jgi:1-acyl-sn-glycerol-3-phosphate acyltransferase
MAFRALLFNVAFYLNTLVQVLLWSPVLLLPRRFIWKAVHSWAMVTHWLLRTICGTRIAIRHPERIPIGPAIVAPKHQSAWETYTLADLLSDPVFVFKRELVWIPIFGWYVAKARMIPVQRGARAAALASVTKRAHEEIRADGGRQIIMFPEGTRRAVGAEPAYKYGVVHLYEQLGVPCVPVALNAGVYWPRRSLSIRPGKIVMEFLEPIPPGLDKDEFMERLQTSIETATARLVAEAEAELGEKPTPAPKRG